MNRALVLVAVIPILLAGCTHGLIGSPSPQPEALEVPGLTVKQIQASGPPPAIYQGTIYFPYCSRNPNDFEIMVQGAFEVYQRRGTPGNEYLHLVNKIEAEPNLAPPQGESNGSISYRHSVLVNETTEGGFNYTVHIWHEILDPEPIHRWDFWYNLTFVPYQQEVYYEKGPDCWIG